VLPRRGTAFEDAYHRLEYRLKCAARGLAAAGYVRWQRHHRAGIGYIFKMLAA
jgi:hypothetical protein